MRPKKRSDNLKAEILLAVAAHAAMGIALGLVFTLILMEAPFFGIRSLIMMSDDPVSTMVTFTGTAVLMFGVGAALTGVVLMMVDA
jgi:hypothetical protein